MFGVRDWQQWQQHFLNWRRPDQRLRLALLALAVATSNPLACLVHCWVHTHPAPLAVLSTPVAQHGHEQHGDHGAAQSQPTTDPTPADPAAETFCQTGHLAPSPLTIAVLTVLLLFTFWFSPTVTWQVQPLLLRLPDHPPPRRPPRF